MNCIFNSMIASVVVGHRLQSQAGRWLHQGASSNMVAPCPASLAEQALPPNRLGCVASSKELLKSFFLKLRHLTVSQRRNWRVHRLGNVRRPCQAEMTGASSNARKIEMERNTTLKYTSEEKAANLDINSTIEEVVETLSRDLPKILQEAPSWGVFAEDVKIVDQTGSQIEGSIAMKYLLKLARKVLPQRFEISDVLFTRTDVPHHTPSDRLFVGRLKFCGVRRKEEQWLGLRMKEEPIDFEAEIFVSLNAQHKIDQMRVNKWLANGKSFPFQLKFWPDVTLDDKLAVIVAKIRDWYAAVDGLKALNVTTFEKVRDTLTPTRREFATTAAIQVGVLLIGRGEIKRLERRNRDRDFDGIQSLQEDIPRILVEEPDWSYFDEDFTLIDQVGVKIKGIAPNRRLLKLVRNLRDGLFATPLKADYDARTEQFFLDGEDGSRIPVVVAHWTLSIDLRARIPYDILSTLETQTLANLKVSTFPIVFAGTSCFQFTQENKVKFMKIDEWSINGKKVQLDLTRLKLPIRGLSDADADVVKFRRKVKELEDRIVDLKAQAEAQTHEVETPIENSSAAQPAGV